MTCFLPKPNCMMQARPTRPRKNCARAGLVYDGELEKPKGKEIEDWEPVTLAAVPLDAIWR